jgi:hypothetical protein
MEKNLSFTMMFLKQCFPTAIAKNHPLKNLQEIQSPKQWKVFFQGTFFKKNISFKERQNIEALTVIEEKQNFWSNFFQLLELLESAKLSANHFNFKK